MEVIGFRDSSPASIILQHIQRQGKTTIKELEEVLGVSTTAVREHLAHLQASGLIATSTMRYGPGRPRLVYTLTAKAQGLFPKHYDLLIHLMLQELAAEGGIEKVEQLLERVGARLANEYADRVSSTDIRVRLDELQQTLEAKGIPAEVDTHEEESTIHIHSCPYFDVAREHGEVCTMERQMFEQVLGEEVQLERSIREGHHHCSFVLNGSRKSDIQPESE
jgi:predicted ArsR family transcriptional regulator